MKQSQKTPTSSSSLTAQELGVFFTINRAEFLRHSKRLLGATSEAEEVVQDALVRVLLASPELSSGEHARAYFHKVIENLAFDIQRRIGRQPRLVVLDEVTSEDETRWMKDSDVSSVLEQADDAAIIREAIALLSPAERAALVMWEFEGRSASEIALELGVKESSVRHTLSRARANLRRVLAERVVDKERGLTALDLLSVTFRKAEAIAQKSSKVALSLVLVISAFLGFNSLSPSDFEAEPVVGLSQKVANSNRSNSTESDSFNSEESRERELTLSVEDLNVSLKSQPIELNSTSVESVFPGLNADGAPTGFTVADSLGNLGVLFGGQQRVVPSESGLLISNIASTRSGAANILLNQSVIVDVFGTSYVAEVSVGINGGWHLLNLSFVSSDVERLPSGDYLLTAIMMVDSALETAVKVSTGTSGTDLDSAPEYIASRVLLDPTKTKILAQAVFVSGDSQGNGA